MAIPSSHKPLIDHLSRLEGQLASIKKELQSGDPDCVRMGTTLRAASRSFGSFKYAFVRCFLATKILTPKQAASASSSDTYQALLDLLRS